MNDGWLSKFWARAPSSSSGSDSDPEEEMAWATLYARELGVLLRFPVGRPEEMEVSMVAGASYWTAEHALARVYNEANDALLRIAAAAGSRLDGQEVVAGASWPSRILRGVHLVPMTAADVDALRSGDGAAPLRPVRRTTFVGRLVADAAAWTLTAGIEAMRAYKAGSVSAHFRAYQQGRVPKLGSVPTAEDCTRRDAFQAAASEMEQNGPLLVPECRAHAYDALVRLAHSAAPADGHADAEHVCLSVPRALWAEITAMANEGREGGNAPSGV